MAESVTQISISLNTEDRSAVFRLALHGVAQLAKAKMASGEIISLAQS